MNQNGESIVTDVGEGRDSNPDICPLRWQHHTPLILLQVLSGVYMHITGCRFAASVCTQLDL